MSTNDGRYPVELYNGWTNRETWATYLWLTNEEYLYKQAIAIVRHPFSGNQIMEDQVSEVFELLFDFDNITRELYSMREDIGSLWRVDWRAIVLHLIEDAVQWGSADIEEYS